MHWEKEKETMPREQLRDLQEMRFRASFEKSLRSPFYGKRFRRFKVRGLQDVGDLPFTTKEDLRKSYPYGMLTEPLDKITRVHGSSGTTGKSTLIFHTARDIENWTNLVARCLYMAEVRQTDIFQNMMSYGIFTGGLGLHYGAERIGALVIPAGTGNTQKQFDFLTDLKSTVLHITPSYLFYIGHVSETMGMPLRNSFSIRTAIMGAEPHSEETRKKLQELFGIKIYNCYGLSEMNGPGVAFECPRQNGMHIWEDFYLPEIIDPLTGEVLADGKEGELVLTTLNREGMPIIRYRTRDITKIMKGRCRCGRTHRRISRIKGRTDDMFIIKGVNIFPSQIETVLMKIPEIDKNYLIILNRKEHNDTLTVQAEIKSRFFEGDINQLRKLQEKIREELKESIIVTPEVELVEPGTLPPSTGKAQRVIDKRRV